MLLVYVMYVAFIVYGASEVRTFLLETSVLERLSGALCDAVTGRAGSQVLLEQVERAGLFLVPLDEVRGWWRYHHLFADLLRSRLLLLVGCQKSAWPVSCSDDQRQP
jgi:ATP/maltotriose-dependent transcriptional regulator MalT